MMLSVMVMSTGATSFTDEDKVSDNYAEAVEVLTGMGVIKGDDNNAFRPQDSITRAEVSTLIYRAATADVNNGHPGLTAGAKLFDDVSKDDWFAGYVNYCADAEYVKGYEDNTFRAANDVTGYEVLAMILRAVGYDKNNEFTGLSWTIQVASTATKLDMLENLDSSVDLAEPASREVVAELIFQAIGPDVDTVHFSPAAGKYYADDGKSLGEREFDLTGPKDAIDDWGRPGTQWTYNTGDEETVIAMDAVATYTEAATECDVAEAVGLEKTTQVDVYTNGAGNKSTDNIRPLATTAKLGDQGQIMELYDANDDGKVDRIVYIDTYLAYVDEVNDATFDKAGHLDDSSELVLQVYTTKGGNEKVTLYGGETNYDYAEGDMILVNAVDADKGEIAQSMGEYGETPDTLDILGIADSIVGTQTHIFQNASKHEVSDEVYLDAVQFNRDDAQDNGDENFAWFFDQYGNLIGSAEIADTLSYGVITSIWWSGDSTDGSGKALANVTYMDGTTGQVTLSEMTYSDATVGATYSEKTGTPVYSTNSTDTDDLMVANGEDFGVATSAAANAAADTNGILYDNLFQFTAKADGTVTAMEVAGNGTDGLYDANIAISKDNVKNFTADNSTVFLIRSGNDEDGYTFESITGINNIGKYDIGDVDYVDANEDGVADYVYVIASSVASKTTNLFYYNDGQLTQNTATKLWTVEGYLDGEEGSIVLNGNDKAKLKDNTLYKVNIVDGEATLDYTFTETKNITQWAYDNVYEDDTPIQVVIVAGEDGYTWGNNLYQADSNGNFIANADSAVVGDWSKDMSEQDVILVVNSDENRVLQAYIVKQAEDGDQPEAPEAATFEFRLAVPGGETLDLGSIEVTGNGTISFTLKSDSTQVDWTTSGVTVTKDNREYDLDLSDYNIVYTTSESYTVDSDDYGTTPTVVTFTAQNMKH